MSETPPPPPPQPAAQPSSGQNPNNMAGLAHALQFTGILGPLIVWLIGKDQDPFVDSEGKKAVNFSILVTIGYIVSSVLSLIFIGFLLWIATLAVAIIFGIQGYNSASKGTPYDYPFNVNWVK
jgi:hypothetical protein